jgi:hypothetical protein
VTAYPVGMCEHPDDAAYLPWVRWRVDSTPNSKNRGDPAMIMRLRTGVCNGNLSGLIVEAAALSNAFFGDESLWRFVPINDSQDGRPIFRLVNKAHGDVTRGVLTPKTIIGRDHGYIGQGAGTGTAWTNVIVHGVTFDAGKGNYTGVSNFPITTALPDLWIRQNDYLPRYRMFWVLTYGDNKHVSVPINYYGSLGCTGYTAGFQQPPDGNDEGDAYLEYLEPNGQPPTNMKNIYLPNPFFGQGTQIDKISKCIASNCTDVLSTSAACRQYLTTNPGNTTIYAMLDKYCTDVPARSVNDPLCSTWCTAGQSDPSIRARCIAVRQKNCLAAYDSTTKTWNPGVSDKIKNDCGCYMPQDFYKQLLAGSTVPDGATPNCFYQGCAESIIGAQTYDPTTCNGVTVCVQDDGTKRTVDCVTTPPVTPVEPPPPNPNPSNPNPNPNPNPSPNPNPPVIIPPSSTSYTWIWWVIGIAIVLLIVAIIAYFLLRKPKPVDNSAILIPLLLAASQEEAPSSITSTDLV